ncbi:MAG TPA: hypothetical protein VN699_10700 [Pirellulales bacterium]|nr:hypothetical protein [Pirellulales bacterium]
MLARCRPPIALIVCLLGGPIALFARGAETAAEVEAEQIAVRLASGRTFTGAVDDRTNSEQLWLRFDKGGVSILRPIPWPSIAAARRGEQGLTADELRAAVAELRSTRPSQQAAREPISANAEGAEGDDHAQPDMDVPEKARPTPAGVVAGELVRSIHVEASVSSWNSGVETDGLVLSVAPLDSQGCVFPAAGTLEVDLFGDHYGSPARGQNYRLLGHWVCRLDAEQVTPEGAWFRLPFQAISPDFRTDLSPYAVVHVRLTAPGHGTFDATTGTLRLRAYSGLRDRLQQAEGSRFFPNERTGRGRTEQ